jgi:ABC-type antimicrobial peptide transport system permease subunit
MEATVNGILIHINKDFISILIVLLLIGAGIGYFLTSILLSFIYEYHTSVEFVTLVLCGILVGMIALATTAMTILSAANTNPAHILRDE